MASAKPFDAPCRRLRPAPPVCRLDDIIRSTRIHADSKSWNMSQRTSGFHFSGTCQGLRFGAHLPRPVREFRASRSTCLSPSLERPNFLALRSGRNCHHEIDPRSGTVSVDGSCGRRLILRRRDVRLSCVRSKITEEVRLDDNEIRIFDTRRVNVTGLEARKPTCRRLGIAKIR